MTRVVVVPTPAGPARAHLVDPDGPGTRATVVLGHGAGGGIEARDLAALADVLPRHGFRVVLVEQPWRVAGRRIAPAPATLDLAWRAVVDRLRAEGELAGRRLVVGGRSAGARVACRTAAALGADGVLALAFPLHPPGRPGASRAGEAAAVRADLAVVQGERDPFGAADEVRTALPGVSVTGIPCADHGFATPRTAPLTQAEALELLTATVSRRLAEWGARTRR